MREIDDYSDDELLRLLSKCEGVQGGADRLAAIKAAVEARGLQDGRAELIAKLGGLSEVK